MKTLNHPTTSKEEENIKIKLIEALNRSNKKKTYRDVKLLLPVNISGKAFNVEVKFVLKNRKETNEKGLYHHAIYALEQEIKLNSRDRKCGLKTKIKQASQQAIKNNPELIEQLSKDKNSPITEEKAIETIYQFLLKKTTPLAIP
jgi:hypothetical protein